MNRRILLMIGVLVAIPGVLFSWVNIADKKICQDEPCLSIFNVEQALRSQFIIIGLFLQVIAVTIFTVHGTRQEQGV